MRTHDYKRVPRYKAHGRKRLPSPFLYSGLSHPSSLPSGRRLTVRMFAPSQRYTYDRSPALHRGAARCNSRRACDALMLGEEFLRDSEQRNAKLVDKSKRNLRANKQLDRQTNRQTNTQTNWRLTTSSTAAPHANPVPLRPAQTGALPLRRTFQLRLGSGSEASGVGANLLHCTTRTLNNNNPYP
jgi:hypothetical protein